MADINLRTAGNWVKGKLGMGGEPAAAVTETAATAAEAPAAAAEPAAGVQGQRPIGPAPGDPAASIARPASLRAADPARFQMPAEPAGPAGQGTLRPQGGFGAGSDVWSQRPASSAPDVWSPRPPNLGVSPQLPQGWANPMAAEPLPKPTGWAAGETPVKPAVPSTAPPFEGVPESPIKVGGQSAEAAAWQKAQSLRTPVGPAAPTVAGTGLSKIAPPLAVGMGAYNAVAGAREGDYMRAGLGVADTAAGFGLTNPVTAGPSAVWLGGRAGVAGAGYVGEKIQKALPEDTSDFIGNMVNKGVRAAGGLVGADWGASDRQVNAYEQQKGEQRYRAASAAAEPPVDMRPNDTPRGSVADSIARGAPAESPAPPDAAQPEETLRAPDSSPGAIAWSVVGGETGRGTRYMTNDGRAITEPDQNNADAQAVSEFNNPTQRADTQRADTQAAQPGLRAAGTSPMFERALAAEGITGAKADLARAHYLQESGAGKNTATSNAGAVGGMQVLPGTFNEMADKGWDINNPEHNARAGIRYASKMYDAAGGDMKLAAAGYYGGLGGMAKARAGQAVADPRNPNAPNTLQYAEQVAARASSLRAGQGAAQQPQQQAAQQQSAAPRSLRDQAVSVIEGANQPYYEVPDGGGRYQKVSQDVFQEGLRAKGGLEQVLGDLRDNQQQGRIDALNPQKIEREKLAMQAEQNRALREQTAMTARINAANLERDNRRADQTAKEASSKSLSDFLSTEMTKDDGKGKQVPDAARVAEAHAAITTEVGHRIRQLQQDFPPGHPQHAAAQQQIQRLSENGVGAFDDADRQVLASQFKIMERARANHGPWTPGGSDFVQGPLSGYAAKPGDEGEDFKLFGSNMAVLKNGTRIRKNDLRYNELSNRMMVDIGKAPTRDFDAGLRGH